MSDSISLQNQLLLTVSNIPSTGPLNVISQLYLLQFPLNLFLQLASLLLCSPCLWELAPCITLPYQPAISFQILSDDVFPP